MQRSLAAGHGNRAYAAFQCRDALLQHCIGGVADAAVDMAGALQVEQAGRMVAGFKDEGGRQMNGHGACTGRRVRLRACVQA